MIPRVSNDFSPESLTQELLRILDLRLAGEAKVTIDAPNAAYGEGQLTRTVFVGPSTPQPHGRVYGGQVLAQTVIAAGRTVQDLEPARSLHSLHAYFLRPGDSKKDVQFTVENLRDGRSYSARRVHALQNGHPILSCNLSFQVLSSGVDHASAMPHVPMPEQVPTTQELVGDIDHPIVKYWARGRPIDLRHVEGPIYVKEDPQAIAQQNVWMKTQTALPDDPLIQVAALAYASDYTMLEPVLRRHRKRWANLGHRMASLDHAMWFHRAGRIDDWVLYSQESPSASSGRGLGMGRIFSRDGEHIATVMQEGMTHFGDDSHNLP